MLRRDPCIRRTRSASATLGARRRQLPNTQRPLRRGKPHVRGLRGETAGNRGRTGRRRLRHSVFFEETLRTLGADAMRDYPVSLNLYGSAPRTNDREVAPHAGRCGVSGHDRRIPGKLIVERMFHGRQSALSSVFTLDASNHPRSVPVRLSECDRPFSPFAPSSRREPGVCRSCRPRRPHHFARPRATFRTRRRRWSR